MVANQRQRNLQRSNRSFQLHQLLAQGNQIQNPKSKGKSWAVGHSWGRKAPKPYQLSTQTLANLPIDKLGNLGPLKIWT